MRLPARLLKRRNLLLATLIVATGALAGAASTRSTATGMDTPAGVLYIASLRTPEVIALSLSDRVILQRYPLPAGAHEFVQSSDGALYASMYRGQAIARLQPSFALIPTAPRPHGMVALPSGVILLTLGDEGAVAAISPDGAELWRAAVGPQHHAIALSPDDLAYVANGGDGTVSVVDVTTHRELRAASPAPSRRASASARTAMSMSRTRGRAPSPSSIRAHSAPARSAWMASPCAPYRSPEEARSSPWPALREHSSPPMGRCAGVFPWTRPPTASPSTPPVDGRSSRRTAPPSSMSST